MRYDDINPMDIDPDTGRPYSNYSSDSLDTSFHDAEMDVDEETFVNDLFDCDHDWKPVRSGGSYCPLCGYLSGETGGDV